MLQKLSDPKATLRRMDGKVHRGYVVNLEESVGTNNSTLLKNHLTQMKKQDEKVTMIADGAYSRTKNRELAEEKNVELITTDLTENE